MPHAMISAEIKSRRLAVGQPMARPLEFARGQGAFPRSVLNFAGRDEFVDLALVDRLRNDVEHRPLLFAERGEILWPRDNVRGEEDEQFSLRVAGRLAPK